MISVMEELLDLTVIELQQAVTFYHGKSSTAVSRSMWWRFIMAKFQLYGCMQWHSSRRNLQLYSMFACVLDLRHPLLNDNTLGALQPSVPLEKQGQAWFKNTGCSWVLN